MPDKQVFVSSDLVWDSPIEGGDISGWKGHRTLPTEPQSLGLLGLDGGHSSGRFRVEKAYWTLRRLS